MICLLKNGHRVYWGKAIPEDKKEILTGTLLCVVRYDGKFDYQFCWEDVVQTF